MIVYGGPVEDTHQLIQFFRRESGKLRSLRKLIIDPAKTVVLDVNRDGIEFPGLTYGSPALEALIEEVDVVVTPQSLHDPTTARGGVKEFLLSARHPWGEDRVM